MPFRDLQDLANDTLFSAAQFGEAITYTPAGVAPVPIELLGVYAQEPIEVGLGDGQVISSTRHVLSLRRDDVSGGPQKGATVTVRTVDYDVIDVEGPDDSGVVKLVLHLADDV